MSAISTWPPLESNIRLPVDVETVLAALPIVTELAVMLPEPIDIAFVLGLIVNVESEETATPAPFCLDENKI